MGLSRQAAQMQLDKLLVEGMVTREEDPADRRAVLHRLTANGQAQYAKADAVWSAWVKNLTKGIPAASWREATNFLTTLIERLESEDSP